MKASLQPGLTYVHRYAVPEAKTVPYLFPESPILAAMPRVLATGFMVGLFEWACAELLEPHLEPGEGSVGVHVDFSHTAATPPGLTITVTATLTKVDGRRLEFEVRGHDGVHEIGSGRHHRAVVLWERFNEQVSRKRV